MAHFLKKLYSCCDYKIAYLYYGSRVVIRDHRALMRQATDYSNFVRKILL